MTDAGLSLDDLSKIFVVASPERFGERVVYVLRRIDEPGRKTRSSLHVVAESGGESRPLTLGEHADRTPRADAQGRFLVFVSDRGAGEQLYRMEADGGEARQLTSLPRGSIGEVQVSPDGARLVIAFAAAVPDDDALPLAGELLRSGGSVEPPEEAPGANDAAASATVTPAKPTGAPRARVATRVRNREDGVGWLGGRTHLWVVDATTGRARRVTSGHRDFGFPRWSPSGDFVVATATRLASPGVDPDLDSTRNELVRVDVATRALSNVAKPEGFAVAPSVSPDGTTVAYLLGAPDDLFGNGNPVACVTPLAPGGTPRVLTRALDRPAVDMVIDDVAGGAFSFSAPVWSRTGTELVLVVSDAGSVRLYAQPVAHEGGGRWITAPGHAVSSPVPLASGGWAAVHGTAGSFTELAHVSASGEIRALSTHNAALTQRTAPRTPELVRIERDGVTISAYYLAPRDATPGKRAPGVLYIHGGPHVCYGERLFFEMQWLADAGFAVLYTNPRGSHSFGEQYARAIHFHWGDPDLGDQLAFTDWLAARPEVDAARLGVAGGSYGGFMTLLLCASTDRFGAAVAQRGLYNWVDLLGTGDFGHESLAVFDGAMPWEAPARYFEHSPIRLVDRVKTPMLVLHNEGDLRVTTAQGIELFTALRLRGKQAALVIFPEEDHGLSRGGRIDRRRERLRQIRGWLDTWLR